MKARKHTGFSPIGFLVTSCLVILSQNLFAAGPSVFINEIHYDNTGTDAGEAIEVAGPAGTDLTGWSLVLYNGSNSLVYDTDALAGVIADLGGGFGVVVVNYPVNGIQNGSPDGIALVDAGSSVVQFLSYEGSFVAGDGPAAGMASTDIGVTEGSGTAVGDSLQLTGSGAGYGDFSWAVAQPNTFGAFNTGQSFIGGVPAISFNEVVASTPSTDWEFIELVGAPGSDLSELAFLEVNRFGEIDDVLDLAGLAMPGDGYFVAASPAAEAQYGFIADLGFPDNFLTNNTNSYLLVQNFTGADGDDLDVDDDGTLDSMPWDAVVSQLALTDDLSENTYAVPVIGPDGSFLPAGAYLCDSGWEMHLFATVGVDGTPGAANSCVAPPAPTLVINEIHADPDGSIAGDANGDGTRDATQDEFVEMVNVSGADLDVSGWTLSDGFGERHTFPPGTLIAPECSIVVFGGGTPTGDFGFSNVQTASTGALGLNNGGDTITISDGVTTVAYSYGGEGGDNQSLTRDPDITGPEPLVKHTTAAGSGGALFSPGTRIDGTRFDGCAIVYADRKIHEIQGNGLASPYEGSYVAIEGIVIGDFQDGGAGANGDLNGFFVQEEDSDADGDPQTSEGIFVFDGNSPAVNVALGDAVRVEGQVAEFFDLTEISSVASVTPLSSGNPLPTASPVSLPVASVDDLEWFEGMRVTFPQDLYVSGNFTLGRYGEVDLAVGGPLDIPTNVVAPGAPALALQADNLLRRIQLDDGSSVQNPLPLPPYLGDGNTLRVGDLTSGLSGVLSYGFGAYEIQPTGPVSFDRANERPDGPPDVGPALISVAGFNVLNYFTTIDTGAPICGPLLNQGCRGADSPEEFTRQKDKLLAALSILDADVIGLTEIENAPDDVPVADLVDGLNGLLGAGTYEYIPTGAIGSDAIRQALIYRPAAVTPMGSFAVLDSSVDPTFLDDKNRPALAQSFAENSNGEVFTVAVNHLKSKGSDCNDVGDPDAGDGQGNCNGTREAAAIALVNWLAGDPTASGSGDTLIIGDLNAYAMEDPVVAIESAGYVDLIESLVGSGYASGAYSFSFGAEAGYLDHALASTDLVPGVSGTAVWHINSDEPVALDYNTEFNQPGLYAADEFRSSDHDAVRVGLYPDEDGDGVWDGLDYCPGTVIPESVPEIRLGVNHFALVDGDGLFDTTLPEGMGPGDSFNVFDTAGCSCEQIIEEQELGKGLRKFGCPPEVMRDWVELMASP